MSEVLVAVDGRDASMRALAFAADRADRAGDTLHVVHVSSDSDEADEQIRERVAETLSDYETDVEVDFVERGSASRDAVGEQLLTLVAGHDYEMVVIGNEPRGAVREFIVGSVAKKLVDARDVPVLLVP